VVRHPALGHRRFEIDAAFYWSFPLDGPASTPGGALSLGYSFRRGIGLDVRAGVEGATTASRATSSGTVSIESRRVPVAAQVHLDLRVPAGAVRLAAGPLVALWLASAGGLPRPSSQVLAEPGATVNVGYRLDLGRFDLTVGVALDVLFVAHDLTIGGAGTLARTSLVEVLPYLAAGLQIF
jgi:hypothetical protein